MWSTIQSGQSEHWHRHSLLYLKWSGLISSYLPIRAVCTWLADASVRDIFIVFLTINKTQTIWRIWVIVSGIVFFAPDGKCHVPPALAPLHRCDIVRLAYMDPLHIALLYCGSVIGFRAVISSAQSEDNGSFNGNHEKLCAQCGCAVRSERWWFAQLHRRGVCLLLPAASLNHWCLCRLSGQVVHFRNNPLKKEFQFGTVRCFCWETISQNLHYKTRTFSFRFVKLNKAPLERFIFFPQWW